MYFLRSFAESFFLTIFVEDKGDNSKGSMGKLRLCFAFFAALCLTMTFGSCAEDYQTTYSITSSGSVDNDALAAKVATEINSQNVTNTYTGHIDDAKLWFTMKCNYMASSGFVDGLTIEENTTLTFQLRSLSGSTVSTRLVMFYTPTTLSDDE